MGHIIHILLFEPKLLITVLCALSTRAFKFAFVKKSYNFSCLQMSAEVLVKFCLELCTQIQIYNNFYSNLLGITQFRFFLTKCQEIFGWNKHEKMWKWISKKKWLITNNLFSYGFKRPTSNLFILPSLNNPCICENNDKISVARIFLDAIKNRVSVKSV